MSPFSWQGQSLCGLSLVFVKDWRVVICFGLRSINYSGHQWFIECSHLLIWHALKSCKWEQFCCVRLNLLYKTYSVGAIWKQSICVFYQLKVDTYAVLFPSRLWVILLYVWPFLFQDKSYLFSLYFYKCYHHILINVVAGSDLRKATISTAITSNSHTAIFFVLNK